VLTLDPLLGPCEAIVHWDGVGLPLSRNVKTAVALFGLLFSHCGKQKRGMVYNGSTDTKEEEKISSELMGPEKYQSAKEPFVRSDLQ